MLIVLFFNVHYAVAPVLLVETLLCVCPSVALGSEVWKK